MVIKVCYYTVYIIDREMIQKWAGNVVESEKRSGTVQKDYY